jgi:DNA helicase HerA-like ATPase
MLQWVGEHGKELSLEYGNVSAASIGAIQRGLLTLEENGGTRFFGEPALNIHDLIQTDAGGRGVINILAAEKLLQTPMVYSTLLLWMLSELFEQLPEAGDLDKPKLVFFFDEAHILFDEAPRPLLEKIEQVVRLIRSKGVGVYFVTQNPLDVADEVLAQLGNRVQHALRSFTAKDQKAVRAAAETFRADGSFNIQEALGQLEIGEAVVSALDASGTPTVAQRVRIAPPVSQLAPITKEERAQIMSTSIMRGIYDTPTDRESAFERLKTRTATGDPVQKGETSSTSIGAIFKDVITPSGGSGGRARQGPLEAFFVSVARSAGGQVGRQVLRGILGSLMGKGSRR